jgi:hypothetical protein
MDANPNRQSGAERASRIQLQYYKGWDRRAIGRAVAAIAGLVLALGYVLYGVISGDTSQAKYSRGPVSSAHASFEHDCSKCHDTQVAGDPIHSNAFFRSKGSLKAIEGKCSTCHKTGEHLSNEMHASSGHEELSCTACHSEHRGRQFNPATVADSKCVTCHEKSVGQEPGIVHPAATAFHPTKDQDPAPHPDFFGHLDRDADGALKDPGNVNFNHELHLRAGIYDPDSKVVHNRPMKWIKIPELDVDGSPLRERYRKGKEQDVQLTCTDCHQAGNIQAAANATRTDIESTGDSVFGDDIPPIRFEDHCRACHPLSVGKGIRIEHGVSLAVIKESIDSTFGVSVQSVDGLSREALKAFEGVTDQESKKAADDLSKLEVWLKSPDPEAKKDLKKYIATKGPLMRLKLTAEVSCLLCHNKNSLLPNNHLESEPIQPPPHRWLKFGYFPHVRHEGLSCEHCHTTSRKSTEFKDVALSNMQSKCFQCHRSGDVDAKGPVAGSNCVDCHGYHRERLDSILFGRTKYQVVPKNFLEASGSSSGKE